LKITSFVSGHYSGKYAQYQQKTVYVTVFLLKNSVFHVILKGMVSFWNTVFTKTRKGA